MESSLETRNRALGDQLTEMAAQLSAAEFRFLELVAEFDEVGGWVGTGIRSCAHWLNWKCGVGIVAARERVRVARALRALPKVSEAFSRGVVSYSKVRAITRVARPETEEGWLQLAESGTASHVERAARHARRVDRQQENDEVQKQDRDRNLQVRWDDDGMLVVSGRLTPEDGALFLKTLEAAMPKRDASAEALSCGQRRADGLAAMAESFAANGPGELSGGERQQVVVHVDAATLTDSDDEANEHETHHIEDGPSVARETIRRMCCDSGIVPMVVDDEGEPMNVGRRTRTISVPLKRALKVRDAGCRFPGCTQTTHVDAHHIEHWADGGETKLSNLVLLCRRHHRLLHEYGYSMRVEADRGFVFTRPTGQDLPTAPRLPAAPDGLAQVREGNAARGLVIDAQTAVPRWYGEPLDHRYLGHLLPRRAG